MVDAVEGDELDDEEQRKNKTRTEIWVIREGRTAAEGAQGPSTGYQRNPDLAV